jgi:putative DNA primase/helicase
MDSLQAAIDRIGNVRLIIVDPIVSAVTGDSHKNTETRRDLQPLVDLAANTQAALIGITHLSKGGAGGDPVQRVLGSVAFVAIARVVMVAAKVSSDDDSSKRILARGKSNIGPDDGGFEYFLEQINVDSEIEASRVTWGNALSGTAQELLSDSDADEQNGGALDNAKEFLSEVLAGGPVPSKKVQSEAKEAGISSATMRRAREALHVKARKDGLVWCLELPGKKPDIHFTEAQEAY